MKVLSRKQFVMQLTKQLRICAVVTAAVLATACTKSVTVDTDFPVPVVEPVALNVGVQYPEILAAYVEVEEAPDVSQWEIVLGDTNLRMFNTLFNGMFTKVVIIDKDGKPEDPNVKLDAIIEPVLEDLEISHPMTSGTELYGVWLRYTLKVYLPDGTLVTQWPVTGFGQVAKNRFTQSGPVRAAAIMAMRDAATNIILGFVAEPNIKEKILTPGADKATVVVPVNPLSEEALAEPALTEPDESLSTSAEPAENDIAEKERAETAADESTTEEAS